MLEKDLEKSRNKINKKKVFLELKKKTESTIDMVKQKLVTLIP